MQDQMVWSRVERIDEEKFPNAWQQWKKLEGLDMDR